MKKKPAVILVILAVLAVIWCAVPRPLLGESGKLDYMEYRGETIDCHAPNGPVDREAVEDLLRAYRRSALPRPIPDIRDFSGTVHLTTAYNGSPWHILLAKGGGMGNGKPCYMAYTGNGWGYPIRDGDQLMAALLEMLP